MLIIAASWICASDQKNAANIGRSADRLKLTEEETEVIRNRELLDNLEFLENFDSVRHLRLLAQDRAARKKMQPAEPKGVEQNGKRRKSPGNLTAMWIIQSLLAFLIVTGSHMVRAQQTSPTETEEPDRLMPEQTEELLERYRALRKMTPEKQKENRGRLAQFRSMSPEERKVILQSFYDFRKFSPEERAHLRRNFKRWEKLTPKRRMELLRRYNRFLQMNPEQRRRFLEQYRRWQQMSPEERARVRRSQKDQP